MSAIVVPIFVNDVAGALALMKEAAVWGADWVELRCDRATPAIIRAVLEQRMEMVTPRGRLPVIVTMRSQAEGGGFAGNDEALAGVIEIAKETKAEFIDIEFARWTASPLVRTSAVGARPSPFHALGTQIILSAHDFSGRPADLERRISAMAQVRHASILKFAWKAANITEAAEALKLTSRVYGPHKLPLVALAMGEAGQISRLLAAKFKSPFTFASLARGGETAPGQPTANELLMLYRWPEQRPATAVCGVVGWPIGHSLSPAIHNAGFAEVGFDGVYVPLAAAPEYEAFVSAVDALRNLPEMKLRGLSVTIPHKENAIRYVRERGGKVDELSAHIGVINTIIVESDSLYGLNSDHAGALDALTQAMKIRRADLAGKRVAMLGAGGAARAIVAGLAHYGAHTTIFNRTFDRAQTLANDFNGKNGPVDAAPLDQIAVTACDIYINCTPLGMHPKVEECPVPLDLPLGPANVVFDTIYNPRQTRLLELARSKGATVVSGVEMFLRQAAVQFEHFTGRPAPIETFRQVLANS